MGYAGWFYFWTLLKVIPYVQAVWIWFSETISPLFGCHCESQFFVPVPWPDMPPFYCMINQTKVGEVIKNFYCHETCTAPVTLCVYMTSWMQRLGKCITVNNLHLLFFCLLRKLDLGETRAQMCRWSFHYCFDFTDRFIDRCFWSLYLLRNSIR